MRRSVGSVALLSGLLVLSAALVQAQRESTMSVSVPFKFSAGDHEFQEGKCTFEMSARSEKLVISIKGDRVMLNASTLLYQGNALVDPPKNELVLHRYGDNHFLAEVWIRNRGMAPPKAAKERQLEESGAKPTIVNLKIKS